MESVGCLHQYDYLNAHRGEYAKRNAARTPWNHQVDLKVILTLNFFKNKLEFAVDIFNIGNLISKISTQVYVLYQ
jgi:hypothetical protein